MKRLALLAIICVFLLLAACTSDSNKSNNLISTESNIDNNSEIDTTISPEKEAEEKVVELFESVIATIKKEGASCIIFYKEIEDIYKIYPKNEIISNLYYYCVANDYLVWEEIMKDGKNKIKAQEEATKIDSKYTGAYSEDIITFAKDLLGASYAEQHENAVALQDKYDSLTTKDKAEIMAYVYSRYDYYDKKEGKSSGDKYSDIIFNETAEEYDIMTSDVDKIWMDIDVITYYNSNSPSTDTTSSSSNSSSSSSKSTSNSSSNVMTYDATLKYGSGDVLIAISEDAMDRFFTALSQKLEGSLQELESNGEIGYTEQGTKCNIVKSKITKYQVCLC